MKLADYVAEFIYKTGTDRVFCITGGAVMHLIDSVAKHSKLNYICNLHEQATAMAADGYAKVSGKLGVAMATSGPGATNLLTGCCSAYYESSPVMFLTGQVSVSRLKGDLPIRSYGFQETDVVSIFRPVTKYAVIVKEAQKIRYELEKAYYLAMHGRKGPVLLDIPDEIQREDINPEELERFCPKEDEGILPKEKYDQQVAVLISESKRPVLLLGQGVRWSNIAEQLSIFIEKLHMPVVHTWAALDLQDYYHPLHFGSFGAYGTKYGQYAIEHADLLLAVGARLTTKQTGTPLSQFIPNTKKIVVDIDQYELEKFKQRKMNTDLRICEDAGSFIQKINECNATCFKCECNEWIDELNNQKRLHSVEKTARQGTEWTNPHWFFSLLSKQTPQDTIYVGDTGSALIWMMQALEIKEGQRCISSFNHSPMGYALPAAIGASQAFPDRTVICAMGDGGFQMNIQELATLVQYHCNVKVIIIDNQGYGNIRLGIQMYLNGHMAAVDRESGVAVPNYAQISRAYGIPTYEIYHDQEIQPVLFKFLGEKEMALCIVRVPETYGNDLM